MNHKKGFTIIELIIVIAIIAVLAAVVATSVSGYIKKSKDAAVKSNLTAVQKNATISFSAKSSYNYFGGEAGWLNPASAIYKITGTYPIFNYAANSYCAGSHLALTTQNFGV